MVTIRICPDCGTEIPTSQPVAVGRKIVRIQIPAHFCPVCHASLDGPVHHLVNEQRTLSGIEGSAS